MTPFQMGVKLAMLKIAKTWPMRLGAVAQHMQQFGGVPHSVKRVMGPEGMSRATRLQKLMQQRKARPKITGTEPTQIAGSNIRTLVGKTPMNPALARGRDPMRVMGL